jgi:PAS domain S-box-containing protein
MADNTDAALRAENADLHARLKETEEILRALGAGEVDAITIQTSAGLGVFTLAGAEQPYREMVETMSEGAVTVGSDGLIIYCNQRFADMLKIDLGAVMGTRLVTHFAQPDRPSIITALSGNLVSCNRLTTELLSCEDLVPVNISACGDGAGHCVIIVSDMTEIVAAQDKITNTSILLNNILQSSIKYSIVGATLDRTILFWNEGARRNYGYAADEAVGLSMDILYAPECRNSDAVESTFKKALNEGVAEGEFDRIRKDGSRFPAQTVMTRRDDVSGHPIGYLLISCDISEQRRAAEQLRAISQYARSLLEACLDPLITISPDGMITDVNHATELITGQIRERLIGGDFSIYFTEAERARAGLQRVFSKGFLIDTRLAIRHVAGTVTEVLCNASLYRDASGRVAGAFLVARDISRMGAADLIPSPKRGIFRWRHAGVAAAAVIFVAIATALPTVSRNWTGQHDLSILTATSARMQALLYEVKPTPARVQAARLQLSNSNLGPGYTITYAIAAPNHDPGIIGEAQLLSRYASELTELSTGNCVHPPSKTQDTDLVICPIAGRSGLLGLLFMSWDRGEGVPANFEAASAALKRAGSDIATIWFNG